MANLEKQPVRPRRGRGRTVSAVFLVLLAMLATATASYYFFTNALTKAKPAAGDFMAGQDKINILVMGVDERSDDVGRSDTMFVTTVDTKNKDVAMLSVPRDTRVKIPGHGWDKINHAYAEGGHKLSQQAVEGLLGISIDHYVLINFEGFKRIIDAIGGVDIEVEKRMSYQDPYDNLVINLQPGRQHMDGNTAIKYVRYRDEEGDIGRVQRQQKFMKAVLQQVATPGIITKIPAVIRELSSAIKTDMSTAEMINFATLINDAAQNGLKTDMVPGTPAYINDISYWLPDLAALRQHMAMTLGVTMDDKYLASTRRDANEYQASIPKEMKIVEPAKPKAPAKPAGGEQPKKPAAATTGRIKVDVINASGSAEAGDRVAAILRSRGFEVVGVSNLTSGNYKTTLVIANTTDRSVVDRLTDLPFQYNLQVANNDGQGTQATVVVAKDYNGK